MTVPIHPAATLIVVRERDDSLELYLVKRHSRSGFMPNAHVFPGGRVDPEDGHRDDAQRFQRAAIRESAEECGLLFARGKANELAGASLAQECFAALKGDHTFYPWTTERELVPAADLLVPFSRWVTPSFEKRRFDAQFFLARAPLAQSASFDEYETTAGAWMTPKSALLAYQNDEIYLAPPTLATLEDLSDAVSFSEMCARGTGLERPICPQRIDVDGKIVLALAGDPLFEGEGPPSTLRTRFVQREGPRFDSGRA